MPPEPRAIEGDTMPAIANLRDLGGHPVRGGGRVRPGVVYRSAEPCSPAGSEVLIGLGVTTVVDLRTAHERELRPDVLADGIRHLAADVLEDAAPGTSPAELMTLLSSPTAAAAVLGGGASERMFTDKYREFVTLDSARRAYRRLFVDLATNTDDVVLVHCTTGKDRTGWAVAALLLLLGVPEDKVLDDYLASNDAMRATTGPLLAEFATRGGDPALLEPFMVVRREYLDAGLTEMRRAFGSIEGYFTHGLSIDPATLAALRARLVTHR